ncbi:hypothetical protein [Sphaerochaeta sp.]|uniref:hypothetical protein n=1 Tax=Sphaerochaeta sp. TaxID=1972642 RepID=UPI003D0E05BA
MPDSAFEFTNAEQFSSDYVLPVVVQTGKNYHVIANYRSFLIKTHADISNKKSEGKVNIDVLLAKDSPDRIAVSVVTDILSSSLKYRHQSVTDVAGVVDKLIEDKETYMLFCHLLNYESYTSFIKTALDRDYQSYVKHMKNKAPRMKQEYQEILISNDCFGLTEEITYSKIHGVEYVSVIRCNRLSGSHAIGADQTVTIYGRKLYCCNISNYNFINQYGLPCVYSYFLPSIQKILYLFNCERASLQDVKMNTVSLRDGDVQLRENNGTIHFNYAGVEYRHGNRNRMLIPDYAYDMMREAGIDL